MFKIINVSTDGMSWTTRALRSPTGAMAIIALLVVGLDQLTKQLVVRFLHYGHEVSVIPGFFKLVLWGNSGAAFSMFRGNNAGLALVAVAALVILFLSRRHFHAESVLGQFSLGLIFGGIIGNLVDRITVDHVIDFLFFYVRQRDGDIAGFPAFNVADTAICTGVFLVFLANWRAERDARNLGGKRGQVSGAVEPPARTTGTAGNTPVNVGIAGGPVGALSPVLPPAVSASPNDPQP